MKSRNLWVACAFGFALTACSSGYSSSVRKDISKRMASKHDDFQACYERELERDESLSGEMKIKFFVDDKGRFRGVRVEKKTIESEELEKCVVDETEKLKLAKAEDGKVLVTYQLDFEPEQ